jgi:peptidoglycan hydrolase-like protein with peptidoglycan-binding domain
VHGSFDDETERAVVAFQEYVGLPPDGTAGPVTQVRLYHALPEYRMPVLASRADRRATP